MPLTRGHKILGVEVICKTYFSQITFASVENEALRNPQHFIPPSVVPHAKKHASMKIYQDNIDKQFEFNQGKNLFYKGILNSLRFSPETLNAIEKIDYKYVLSNKKDLKEVLIIAE